MSLAQVHQPKGGGSNPCALPPTQSLTIWTNEMLATDDDAHCCHHQPLESSIKTSLTVIDFGFSLAKKNINFSGVNFLLLKSSRTIYHLLMNLSRLQIDKR